MSHIYNTIIISLIVGLVLGFFIGRFSSTDRSVSKTEEQETVISENIEVSKQLEGNTVNVDIVNIKEDGWVAVREIVNSHMGNILGATRLDKGEYSNVKIELLRPTISGMEYTIVIYRDNGDKNFDFNFDSLVTEGEEPLSKNFSAI